jgi:uncharacterized protein YdeI (BOF family)
MIIIAVVIALAVPALAPRNLNQDSAPQYQSVQYCMPQDDDFADTATIYC